MSVSNIVKTGTPVSAGRQMSASLRERLKRTSRYFKSPSAAASPACKNVKSDSSPIASCQSTKIVPSHSTSLQTHNTSNAAEGDDAAPIENSPCGIKRARKSPRVNKTLSFDTCVNVSNKKTKQDIHTNSPSHKNEVENIINGQKVKEATDAKDRNKVPNQKTQSNFNQVSPHIESAESKLDCDKTNDIKDVIQLRKRKNEIEASIKEKEETLRKLQMVKMYRSKNDLTHMQELVDKWKTVSQEALVELHSLATEPKPSLTSIVDHFNLDHKTIGYNPEEECFEN